MAESELAKLDEPLERMVLLLVKLKLQEVWGEKNLKERVEFLAELGCSSTEISALTGSPLSSVAPVLSRARKQNGKSKKTSRGRRG
jgi:hypothetical protein